MPLRGNAAGDERRRRNDKDTDPISLGLGGHAGRSFWFACRSVVAARHHSGCGPAPVARDDSVFHRADQTTSRRVASQFTSRRASPGCAALGIGDDDPVAENLAERFHAEHEPNCSWGKLPQRARKRWIGRAKHWLVRHALPRMTADRIVERDPAGEASGWLRVIAGLLAGG